jgi:hypothetical protein
MAPLWGAYAGPSITWVGENVASWFCLAARATVWAVLITRLFG